MRVSSLKQDLTAQRKAVLSAARKDYSPSEIIEVQGKESAIKLDEMERQTLNEMKTVVEEYPSIEAIYFFSVDRLARKMSVVMSIKDWADRRQINLVFLNPCPFSTWFKIDGILKKNDISDIYLMFLSFGAKMEMEIKSERFAAAKTLNKEHNKPNGPILYGYTTDANKNLIIDRNSARVIRWIFDCYLKKNMSTTEIYNEGIELGYWQDLRERTAKANRIRHILRNYCYAGRPNKGGLVYPAIVDEEDNIDVKAGLLDEHLIPIEDEIEKRFTK
jgi:DNA invertase Pin-like site-specific DNA recombinase